MSLGYDIAAALPGLRAEAESRMSETVIVGTFKDATDPDTGDPIRVPVTVRYVGKARIRWGSRGVVNTNAPSMPIAVQEPYLSVPIGSGMFKVRDEVHITGSTADPLVVGRSMRIAGDAIAGQATANRYPLEEFS